MTVSYVEILHDERAEQRSLGLDKATRDALAAYCRLHWPQHTAKSAARAWGLSLDEGRGVVAGRASQSTIDKIWKHPDGGWAVALPVLGAVVGKPVHEFFRQQIRSAAQEAERAVEHEQLAKAAYRRLASGADGNCDAGNSAAAARQARGFTRAVGPETARRLAGGDR